VCGCLHSCPQIHPLSSCPVLLSHSSSAVAPPFFLFPPTICWQCKQSTSSSICLSYLLVFFSPSLDSILSELSNQTLLAGGTNERPVEGHPGSFQPRQGPTLPTGGLPGLHKTLAGYKGMYCLPISRLPFSLLLADSKRGVQLTLRLITFVNTSSFLCFLSNK